MRLVRHRREVSEYPLKLGFSGLLFSFRGFVGHGQ